MLLWGEVSQKSKTKQVDIAVFMSRVASLKIENMSLSWDQFLLVLLTVDNFENMCFVELLFIKIIVKLGSDRNPSGIWLLSLNNENKNVTLPAVISIIIGDNSIIQLKLWNQLF